MDLFQAGAILITLAALFNYVNYKYLKLPATIGIMAMALVLSLVVIAIGVPFPAVGRAASVMLEGIDFNKALMNGMLGLLLFAGALHVELGQLTAQKGVVAILATIGVVTSTVLVGTIVYYALPAVVDIEVRYVHCLLFGALISPTDPIAVLGVLKTLKVPKSLETKIAGESLFNDGVGVVVFLALLGVAGLSPHVGAADGVTPGDVALIFVQEALGGATFGLITGGIAYSLLRSVDDYQVEILISLALVIGGYALANALHLSGPIAMVVAGLLIGNQGRAFAMSETTRENLDRFWELIDEILNAVLFVLIGLEMLILNFNTATIIAGVMAVPITLFCRFVAVGLPISVMSMRREFTPHAVKILTWGGLRGGISVALALWLGSLLGAEHAETRDVLLVMTYAVVVFSIIIQGLTISRLIGSLGINDEAPSEPVTAEPEAPAADPPSPPRDTPAAEEPPPAQP
jgi:monovalent cation:H+ antiporter, CPA1 family